MYLVTGSDNGVVKVFNRKSNNVTATWGVVDKNRGVDRIAFSNDEQTEVAVSFQSGDVTFYNLNGNIVTTHSHGERVVGLYPVDSQTRSILTCSESGVVSVRPILHKDFLEQQKQQQQEGIPEPTKSLKLNRPVTSTLYSSVHGSILVAGGEGRLAQLYDIETSKGLWKAKNVPHDFLDMEVPVWDKDVDWVDINKKVFVAATAYNQIRLYDIRAKPRAVLDVAVGEKPFTCVRTDPLKNHIITAANTVAWVNMLDLKMQCRVVAGFKGVSGSVRSMSYHPTEPYLAMVGLDRFLHVFNTAYTDRKAIVRIYLKQKMNAVFMSRHSVKINAQQEEQDDETQKEADEADEALSEDIDDDESEDEDVFNTLQTVGDIKQDQNKKTSSTKSNSNSSVTAKRGENAPKKKRKRENSKSVSQPPQKKQKQNTKPKHDKQ